MPKKDEVKIPKKAKEEMTEQIIEEINSTVKKDVIDSVVSDIKLEFNREYKDSIKEDIKKDIVDDIKKDIAKEQKKLSRSKSFKIFRLYLYLLIVVGALCYLLFRLYETDNLTVIDKSYTRKPTTTEITTTVERTTEVIKDSEYYIKNYGHLLDNIKISNYDLVKNGIEVNNMQMSDKLALAYANVDKLKIQMDGIIHSLKEEDLIDAYKVVFGEADGYSQSNFISSGLNYVYSSSNGSYMAIGEEMEDNYIQNIITNGREAEDIITLEARVYVVKDNAIYNPNNMNYRIMNMTDGADISRVQNRLLSVEYNFKKDDLGYHLMSIVRK